MRVLLISHTCQSRTEGQPRADHLSRQPDVHIKVLTPDRWRHYGRWRSAETPADRAAFEFEAAPIVWPWCGPAQCYLHWYPGLKRTIEAYRPDLIDVWEEPWSLAAAHTCWLRNRYFPQIKIVAETEQNLLKRLPCLFEAFQSYTQRSVDAMACRNAEAVSVVRRKGYPGRTEVVPNAVDTALFRPQDRQRCRQALGIEGFLVGYVGRLVEEKGVLDLVAALRQCPASVQLVMVGDGPPAPALARRIAGLQPGGRVHLRARVEHPELASLINSLDVLALVSHTTTRWKEQFGRVIIEAHACGVPVIGSCSGAIPDVVGRGGILVPEADPAAIAAAIQRLHRSPALARKLGCAGLQQVHAHYSWQRVAGHMHQIYLRALNSGTTSHTIHDVKVQDA